MNFFECISKYSSDAKYRRKSWEKSSYFNSRMNIAIFAREFYEDDWEVFEENPGFIDIKEEEKKIDRQIANNFRNLAVQYNSRDFFVSQEFDLLSHLFLKRSKL